MKRITLRIKTKRKIHTNLGHKEDRSRSPHPPSLFTNLPQILTPPNSISLPHFYIVIYWSTWHWKQIYNSHNWIRGQEEKCYVPYTMYANRRYHVCFNSRKIASHNNVILMYVSFFIYPKSFPCFIFTYSFRTARYFADQYRAKVTLIY
jgi:hypothetical protein